MYTIMYMYTIILYDVMEVKSFYSFSLREKAACTFNAS